VPGNQSFAVGELAERSLAEAYQEPKPHVEVVVQSSSCLFAFELGLQDAASCLLSVTAEDWERQVCQRMQDQLQFLLAAVEPLEEPEVQPEVRVLVAMQGRAKTDPTYSEWALVAQEQLELAAAKEPLREPLIQQQMQSSMASRPTHHHQIHQVQQL
jgi:hypothetical protein